MVEEEVDDAAAMSAAAETAAEYEMNGNGPGAHVAYETKRGIANGGEGGGGGVGGEAGDCFATGATTSSVEAGPCCQSVEAGPC